MRILLVMLFFFVTQSFLHAQEYNILDFNAVADGTTLNTVQIQRAIDTAHLNGGGRVVVPAGRFLTGSIILKSKVELYLHKKAVLLGSTDPTQYQKLNRLQSLILAEGQVNISITGNGMIDGQGRALALHVDSLFHAGQLDSTLYDLVEGRPTYFVRPQLLEFVKCKEILVRDITLKNAAFWVQTYDQCDRVTIDHIRVDSDAYWNNDGIDIQDCQVLSLTNSYFNCSDDGICLKSQSSIHSCDSIFISDCTVRSSASAIKFGTVSHGGFNNVEIKRIKVFDTFRSVIAIECVDGGVLENISIDNVRAKNTGNAIFIRLGDRNPQIGPGILRNLSIKNVKVEIASRRPDENYEIRGPDLPFFHNTFPSSITGIPGHAVENVVLEDIEIRYAGGGNNGLANMPLSRLDKVPERDSHYPEFSMFGELPAWGFYVRHVDGLQLKNVKLRIKTPDYRPSFVFDDTRDLSIQGLEVIGEKKSKHIILHNSTPVMIDNTKAVWKM